jgi:hypothetical protein
MSLPAVCLIDDICRELQISRSTLKRLRRAGAFPIPELPSLDKHPRWSRAAVEKFLEGQRKPMSWRRNRMKRLASVLFFLLAVAFVAIALFGIFIDTRGPQ